MRPSPAAGAIGWRYPLLLGLVTVGALGLGWLPPEPRGTTTLLEHWQYRWSTSADLAPLGESWDAPGWESLELPAHPPKSDAPILWLRSRIPANDFHDAAVAIDAVTAPFEAYLGTALRQVHPAPEGLATRVPPGIPWQLIHLPAPHEGELFTLRVRAAGIGSVLRGTPLFGERVDLLTYSLGRDLPRLVVGFIVILLGLLGGVVLWRRDDWRVPVAFAAYVMGLGFQVINYTHLKELFLDAPRLWFFAWVVVLPLLPVAGSAFLVEIFALPKRHFLYRCTQAQAAVALLLVPCDAMGLWLYSRGEAGAEHQGVVLFGVAMASMRAVMLLNIVVGVWTLVRLSRRGHAEARLFLLGLSILAAFGVRDILAAFGVAAFSWKSQIHVGVLALTTALTLILSRRYTAARDEAAARAKEKERMLRDLHDGFGSLTSNVRVLAELGQRQGDRAGPTLVTIAELAGRALAELRTFVQALDENTMSWELLAAELRHYGAQLVEAAGADFSMQIHLAAPGRPPGLLAVNLIRIFREALTNAVKHGGGGTIRAALRAEPTAVFLQIENAGGDGPKGNGSLDTGRGLGNMRARAAEIAGTLTVELGDPNVVALRVPLPIKPPSPEAANALSSA